MTLNVQNGVRLTTFSGVNIESNGILQLSGGTLDAQFVEIAAVRCAAAAHHYRKRIDSPARLKTVAASSRPATAWEH